MIKIGQPVNVTKATIFGKKSHSRLNKVMTKIGQPMKVKKALKSATSFG